MKVVLIRHAHAVDQDAVGTDEARHLTAHGRELSRKVGERLLADGFVLDVLLTSPLVRAVQTAELVAQAMGFLGEVESLTGLAPGHSVRRAAEELEGRGAVVGAVGHEPSISELAAHLLGRHSHPSLKKAQALVFEKGRVVHKIDPDAL